jgi:hypothetical protein
MVDNIRNDIVTIHRSPVLKMSSLHIDIFCNCFVKNMGTTFLLIHQLSLDGFSNCVAFLELDFDTICFSDFLGVCSSLAPVI